MDFTQTTTSLIQHLLLSYLRQRLVLTTITALQTDCSVTALMETVSDSRPEADLHPTISITHTTFTRHQLAYTALDMIIFARLNEISSLL